MIFHNCPTGFVDLRILKEILLYSQVLLLIFIFTAVYFHCIKTCIIITCAGSITNVLCAKFVYHSLMMSCWIIHYAVCQTIDTRDRGALGKTIHYSQARSDFISVSVYVTVVVFRQVRPVACECSSVYVCM